MTLKDVVPQFDGFIEELSGDSLWTERLAEMGLHQGVRVRYVGRAPFNGPFIVEVGQTMFALREEEAQCLKIVASR